MSRRTFALLLVLIVTPYLAWAGWRLWVAVLAPRPLLTGRVLDAEFQPVAGATVRVPGRSEFATTDAEGYFTLRKGTVTEPLTAYKEGFFIATLRPIDPPVFHLQPLPVVDHEQYQWVSPTPLAERAKDQFTHCGSCHQEIYTEWKSGAHAHSVTGQHFRDLYEGGKGGGSLLKEHPDGAGVCAACHAPTFAANAANDFDLRSAFRVKDELNSVHCDYCHKIVGPADGEVGLTHGRYGLKLLRPEHGQLTFGPLKDANRNDNAFSAFQKDSRLCASCHEGTVFGVHVYSTYSEWQTSPAGQRGVQCQDCHMKPTGKMTNFAPGRGGVERDPKTLANHRFFDGSREEMLKRCLKVNVTPTRDADGVRVSVEVVANDVGHRVPTGFVDRNIVLSIAATDGNGKPVPHRDEPILPRTNSAGRLYAKQLKDFDGHSPAPFWRADPDLIDTRLKPGEPDRAAWRFPTATTTVRVKVIHRRFWPEVAAAKGWTDNDTVIIDRVVQVP